MLSIGPIIIHPGHILRIFQGSLLAQTYQSPRVQVCVISISNQYTQITNCVIKNLFGCSWSFIYIGNNLALFFWFVINLFFLLFHFFLISLFQKIILTRWNDKRPRCIQEFMRITIGHNILHNFLLKCLDKCCSKFLILNLRILILLTLFRHYNDWIKIFLF